MQQPNTRSIRHPFLIVIWHPSEQELDLKFSPDLEAYLTGAPDHRGVPPSPPPGCIPEFLAQMVVAHPSLDNVCGIPSRKILANKVRVKVYM